MKLLYLHNRHMAVWCMCISLTHTGLAPCCHYTAAKGLSLQTLVLLNATRHLFHLSSFIFHFANSACFLATFSITLLLCFVCRCLVSPMEPLMINKVLTHSIVSGHSESLSHTYAFLWFWCCDCVLVIPATSSCMRLQSEHNKSLTNYMQRSSF